MKIMKICHFHEFYHCYIVIKSIQGQISEIPRKNLDLIVKICFTFPPPKKNVPGQNRFYSGPSQNTPKIETFFGYAGLRLFKC